MSEFEVSASGYSIVGEVPGGQKKVDTGCSTDVGSELPYRKGHVVYSDRALLAEIYASRRTTETLSYASSDRLDERQILRFISLAGHDTVSLRAPASHNQELLVETARNQESYSYGLALMLTQEIPLNEIEQLISAGRKQAPSNLIYPGKPLYLVGTMRQQSVRSPVELALHSRSVQRSSVTVHTRTPHGIVWYAPLFRHPVFVLATVTRLGPRIELDAAALIF